MKLDAQIKCSFFWLLGGGGWFGFLQRPSGAFEQLQKKIKSGGGGVQRGVFGSNLMKHA